MDQLTAGYRKQNTALRAGTIRDLQRIWPALDWRRLDDTYPAWLQGVTLIVSRDRVRAADLAAGYVKAFRLASGVPGQAKVVLAPALDIKQLEASMRVTSVVAAKRSAAVGKSPERAMADAFVLSSGAATRHVLNAGRETVMDSCMADSDVTGWERVTAGGCTFCLMLADRGEVYTEAGADFASHDHCNCSAAPAYGGEAKQVGNFTKSLRGTNEADQARARKFMAENY